MFIPRPNFLWLSPMKLWLPTRFVKGGDLDFPVLSRSRDVPVSIPFPVDHQRHQKQVPCVSLDTLVHPSLGHLLWDWSNRKVDGLEGGPGRITNLNWPSVSRSLEWLVRSAVGRPCVSSDLSSLLTWASRARVGHLNFTSHFSTKRNVTPKYKVRIQFWY